ncbi:MAG: hypothetical protein ISR91_02120 [Candidatus Delongbacteria bacterium]|nr:hypothetical protein [Candidatus Delongbacteria bacterium]
MVKTALSDRGPGREISALLFVVLLVSAPACALINIPEDYPLVQQGIDAAIQGDTILIWPGTYIEELEINQTDLTLGSRFLTTNDTSFISNTILDGDSTLHILTCNGPQHSCISGLTFTHGFGYYTGANNQWWGGAISVFDSTEIDIFNCRFVTNYGESNPGITAYDSSSVSVRNCLFFQNTGTRTTLIRNTRGRITIIRGCAFQSNEINDSPIIANLVGQYLSVDSCVFHDNLGSVDLSNSPMFILSYTTWTELTNCLFRNNTLSKQPGIIHLEQADTLIIRDCVFDSTTIESAQYDNGGYSYFINLLVNNDNVILQNIRITANQSTNGNDFGIGIFAQANESLVADSIFVINNYEEFEYDKSGQPGCRLFSLGTVEASNIYRAAQN